MKKTLSVLFCIIILLSLMACNKGGSDSKKAVFEHINMEYKFNIPKGMSCVVDNNDKQTIWLYEKDGDPAQWKIIITLEPATAEEFKAFDINQRAYIKSQTAETIRDNCFLYEYDTDEVFEKIYAIAEYNSDIGCIVFLRAQDSIDKAVSKELLNSGILTKIK